MPLSLRIAPDKEELIRRAAEKAGKSKTAFILDAVYEKIGLIDNRQETIRQLAGWMSHAEAEKLRHAVAVFNEIHEGDWE